MRAKFYVAAFAALITAMPAMAQMSTVRGQVIDPSGKPMAGITVDYSSTETGNHYTLKTDAQGNYISASIIAGKYKVLLIKDGKTIYTVNNVPIEPGGENVIDVNLQKDLKGGPGATAPQQTTDEQRKQMEEAVKENENIKNLNAILKDTVALQTAGNLDKAIAELKPVATPDQKHDVIFARLGNLEVLSAKKQTDVAARKSLAEDAVTNLGQAIKLLTASPEAQKDPTGTNVSLAADYGLLGNAQGLAGQSDAAVASYTKAGSLDPAHAALQYFNAGAVLSNAGKSDDAVSYFDKAIQADPKFAEAYYQKGIALLGKATLKGDKMVPVAGTEEAFDKYLEIAPNGPNAENAQQMLQSIGAKVKRSFHAK